MTSEPQSREGRGAASNRPRHLALWKIRFPIGAIASIGHRASGALLLLSMPFLPDVLRSSLHDAQRFDEWLAATRSPLGSAMVFAISWALFHHLLAGLRHLLMDIGIGTSLHNGRRSARWVLLGGALAALGCLLAARLT